jgi:very-short-patch-repair endonuclease
VAVDYDGAHHEQRDDDAAVRAGRASDWRQRQDQSRRDLLADLGWVFRVLTSFDIFRRPGQTVERVRETLRRAGALG